MCDDTASSGTGRSLLVLVVEDELLIAMDLEMLLEQNGHQVIGPASSIPQALHLLEDSEPDAAVLDVNVRGQLVSPVAEKLLQRNIPFVLASAYTSLGFDGTEALAGIPNIGKPISERRLFEALARASSD